jgi:hypothetical protein
VENKLPSVGVHVVGIQALDRKEAGDEEGLDQRDTHRLGEVVRAKEKIGAKPKHKPSH